VAWFVQVTYLRLIMIQLLKIAKQILLEGGNVFGTTDSIEKDNIEPTIEKFVDQLSKIFPAKASTFKSFEKFQEDIQTEAMKIQGSGWIYLSTSGAIKTIKNHEVRKDIALLIDWWEHAWALDYQADKQKYLKNIWRIINWEVVNSRL
jgi:superoxide dismutase